MTPDAIVKVSRPRVTLGLCCLVIACSVLVLSSLSPNATLKIGRIWLSPFEGYANIGLLVTSTPIRSNAVGTSTSAFDVPWVFRFESKNLLLARSQMQILSIGLGWLLLVVVGVGLLVFRHTTRERRRRGFAVVSHA